MAIASIHPPPPSGFGTAGDPPLPATADDPLLVSPYLLRPLRSYDEALRDCEINRARWAPRDQPAEGVGGPARHALEDAEALPGSEP